MRLIDADKFKEQITAVCALNGYIPQKAKVLWKIIDQQPTAYDVDRVIKELDRATDYYECEEQGREHVQMIDFTDAVEIVKGGGIV